MRIVCGWCAHATPPGPCDYCGRDPVVPWLQRGAAPPSADHDPDQGRPALEPREVRARYDEARAALVAAGREPTIEAIAERLDRSPRTVRAWKQRFGL